MVPHFAQHCRTTAPTVKRHPSRAGVESSAVPQSGLRRRSSDSSCPGPGPVVRHYLQNKKEEFLNRNFLPGRVCRVQQPSPYAVGTHCTRGLSCGGQTTRNISTRDRRDDRSDARRDGRVEAAAAAEGEGVSVRSRRRPSGEGRIWSVVMLRMWVEVFFCMN